jgi:hypothetical protein
MAAYGRSMTDERRIRERARPRHHIDWIIRPRAYFYEQLENAIQLAAAGRSEDQVEVDCRRCLVKDVISDWELGEFVDRVVEGRDGLEDEDRWDSQY